MNFKFVSVFLLLFAMIFNTYSALNYNATYTDIVLETNGWCVDNPIRFTLFNSSQFENSDFEDDLCKSTQDPSEDSCYVYDTINADIIIYDGPVDFLGEIVNTPFVKNNFTYTFVKQNDYLIQVIINSGRFNDFETTLSVKDCEIDKSTITETSDATQDYDLFNNTFYYSSSDVLVDLVLSNINSQSEIIITEFDKPSERSLPSLENINKLIEVDYSNLEVQTTFSLKTNISFKDQNNFNAYKYNGSIWVKINPIISNNTITISTIDSNYYAFVVNEIEEVIVEESIINITEEISNDIELQENVSQEISNGAAQTVNVVDTSNELESISSSFNFTYIVVGVIIIILLVIIFVVSNKKKSKSDIDEYLDSDSNKSKNDISDNKEKKTNDNKSKEEISKDNVQKEMKDIGLDDKKEGFFSRLFKKKEKEDSSENIENQTGLRTHKEVDLEILNKTQDYVKKYKDTYPKDGIRQALKSVNVSDEIIDKVFNEEFK